MPIYIDTTLTDEDNNWAGAFYFDDYVTAGKGNDTLDGGGGSDVLWGEEGNDHLIGGTGDDVLIGDTAEFGAQPGDGNDTLEGGEGDDELWGGGGNDVLNGGTGADIMYGGDGDDIYYVDDTRDLAIEDMNTNDRPIRDHGGGNNFFATGIDKVYSTVSFTLGSGIENLTLQSAGGAIDGTGNGLDNEIRGNGSANTLTGLDGNDHLYGNGGEDTLLGGNGNDFLYGGSNDDILSGGDNDDVLDGGSGADSMTGGRGNDVYYVDNVGDVASELGGNGEDTVYSTIDYTLPFQIEDLVLQGSAAIDGTGNSSDNLIAGNDADNTLRGLDGEDTLKGGGGADRLYGGTENDNLFGQDGDDDLNGGTGDDHMEGGAGNDTYAVDSLGDEVVEAANAGIDTVTASGNLGHYTLTANVENLNLVGAVDGTGNNLDNVITGFFSSAHVLEGLGGNDTLIGGSGIDTATYEHNSGRVVVTLVDGSDGKATEFATPTATAGSSFDTLRSIENVTGSAFDDQITGNSLDNVIDGRGGADDMAGGNGNDTYVVDNAKDVIHEFAGQGTADHVQTSVSYGLASGVDVEFLETTNASGTAAINLVGNSIGNTITGNNGANTINGGGGADTMSGLGGNDTYIVDNAADVVIEAVGGGVDHVKVSTGTYVLTAGAAVEVLETTNAAGTAQIALLGNEFDNTIIGNAGNDILAGSSGNDDGSYDGRDFLTGGAGPDLFVWTSIAESTAATAQADVITDFNRAEGDLISINSIDANPAVAGDQAFTFIGQGPFTAPGQVSFFTDGTDTFLLLNTDSDAAQEMTIRLNGVHQVDASFFVL